MGNNKVIVTGGTGFVGRNLQLRYPKWLYLSSNLVDLTDEDDTRKCLHYWKKKGYNTVLHLAGLVGGIKDNKENQIRYYEDNLRINYNIVNSCRLLNYDRLLCSLSTCAFPNKIKSYPMKEENILDGPPSLGNFSYAMAKRSMYAHVKACRREGYNFSCFTPSNIYGPFDDFSESGHFVAALIRKVYQTQSGKDINLWGTGKPLRQFLYVKDLVCIIGRILYDFDQFVGDNIIIAPSENISIDEAARTLINAVDKDLEIKYNGKLDGQYRKDCSNSLLREILGKDYKFTSFEDGIKETYEWYKENSNN